MRLTVSSVCLILQRESSPSREEIDRLLKSASGSHDDLVDDDIVVAEYRSEDEAEGTRYQQTQLLYLLRLGRYGCSRLPLYGVWSLCHLSVLRTLRKIWGRNTCSRYLDDSNSIAVLTLLGTGDCHLYLHV